VIHSTQRAATANCEFCAT